MLYSKMRARTISLILLITNLVNFYQAYAVPPQKTYEALSSDDSSESSDCYCSDSEGYCADSEESSDDDMLLHPGEYPEKTSFSNPIPRRKNKNWSHCSSGIKELCIHFGESLDSSGSSSSKRCSGSTASPCFRKPSSSSDSYSSEEYSGSDASPCSRESLSSKKCSGSDAPPFFRKSPNPSPSSHKKHSDSDSDASPCSRESSSSKKRPVSDVSPSFRESSSSSDSCSSEECSGSDASPYSQKSSGSPIPSSNGKVNSSTTAQNLNPALEERNLVMDYIIENVSSHMAKQAKIEYQKIKCYIKNFLLNKNLYNQLNPELLIAVMCYWDKINLVKLIDDTKKEKNELDRFFYTLLTLFCLADKFAGDDLYDSTTGKWAQIGLVQRKKLIHYEKVLLENLDYRLYISQEDYLKYKEILKYCP